MSQYFPRPYESFGGDINVKVDLSNYATKTELKNVTHVDVSSFALKSNLASLKTKVDKLDIEKLAPVPVDLSKLSDVVKNGVAKKTVYDKLVEKVNSIDTTRFVLKTAYDTDKKIESKIPDITGLATNSALTAVQNKMPDISNLVKKTDYNTKLSEIENKLNDYHDECITTSEFNKLTKENFKAILPEANLVTKTDFDTKLKNLNRKVTSNKKSICL